MAQEELYLEPPIPTLVLQLPWVGGVWVWVLRKARYPLLPRPQHGPEPLPPKPESARGLPGGGVGASLCRGRQAGARGHATPRRISVTAEIAEIGCY